MVLASATNICRWRARGVEAASFFSSVLAFDMAQATARKKDIADDPTRLWAGLCGEEGRALKK